MVIIAGIEYIFCGGVKKKREWIAKLLNKIRY